jgi:LysM repeat protein
MKVHQHLFSIVAVFLFVFNVGAQELRKHTVAKGETIQQIAERYRVTPYDIHRLNPDAKNGVRENDLLLIPASVATATKPGATLKHTAAPKETIYGIARQYNVSVDELIKVNPDLADGLKVGQVITIPVVPVTPSTPTAKASVAYRVVEAKETKFGIAKLYGISVAELERLNPGIESHLPVGMKLTLSNVATSDAKQKPITKPITNELPAASAAGAIEITRTTTRTTFANYEVKPGETMFGLTRMFEISAEELTRLNPALADGVKVGMILKVPGKGSVTTQQSSGFEDLAKTASGSNRKRVVILLPFNAGRIQGDTVKSVAERLKKDAFLNMTLDYYSGALMAIDSAKTLGLNFDIRIYDSEESKSGSNIASLIQMNKIREADAVIGPFYQQYAEKTAEMLLSDNVPVISPLSKESGKSFANLFQTMPPGDLTKAAILDYMISKDGNIILVSDPKKVANREFISSRYPAVRFAELSDNGTLNSENLRMMLVKGRMNFVVLDSERTGMILGATNLLLGEMGNYQIQLAILESNETLDFEEISMKRLTGLKLLYPSLTRPNTSPEGLIFENEYRKRNKIYPNQFAVRGFDVTFDTLLRLAQDKSFSASAREDSTQQVESKFNYVKNGEGFVNRGVYVLQYNEDLTVTEAQ